MLPEKNIENKIRTQITTTGYLIKNFASPHTNKGIPDLTGCLNGQYVAIEVKKPVGGKPTPIQLTNLQQIANAGGIAVVSNDPMIGKIIKQQTNNQFISKLKSNSTHPIKHATWNQTKIDIKNQARSASELWQPNLKTPHTLQLIKQSD